MRSLQLTLGSGGSTRPFDRIPIWDQSQLFTVGSFGTSWSELPFLSHDSVFLLHPPPAKRGTVNTRRFRTYGNGPRAIFPALKGLTVRPLLQIPMSLRRATVQ